MNLTEKTVAQNRPLHELSALEKKYRRSKQKILFILLIPVLWGIGAIPAYLIGTELAWEALAGWCIGVTFFIGVYIVVHLPKTNEVVHNYSQLVLPELLRNADVQDARVHKRHDLSVKTFLDSGLYHDKYNAISREDSIQGNLYGTQFGMYEIAMQIGSSRASARTGLSSATRTNHFYGWFIMLEATRLNGFHFITMLARKNRGESDDWHAKTLAHWRDDVQLQKLQSGNPAFDQQFVLNSDQPFVLRSMLTPQLQELLLFLAHTTKNSFAIAIQRSRIFVLIGHEEPTFRKCPDKNFAGEFHPDMVEDVTWFVELVRGLARIKP